MRWQRIGKSDCFGLEKSPLCIPKTPSEKGRNPGIIKWTGNFNFWAIFIMHKLVLMRHGESQWNLENRFTGWTDVDLTDTGREQRSEEHTYELQSLMRIS